VSLFLIPHTQCHLSEVCYFQVFWQEAYSVPATSCMCFMPTLHTGHSPTNQLMGNQVMD